MNLVPRPFTVNFPVFTTNGNSLFLFALLLIIKTILTKNTTILETNNTDNNPFEGIRLRCGIDKVFLRGSLTVDDGRLVKEKLGKYIARGKKQM